MSLFASGTQHRRGRMLWLLGYSLLVRICFSSCFGCAHSYLAATSTRSLSRTTLSCACMPLVSRVCCGDACPLSTGRSQRSQRSVSWCGFVRRSQCRSLLSFLSKLSLLEHTDVVVMLVTARQWPSCIGHRPPDIHQLEPVSRAPRCFDGSLNADVNEFQTSEAPFPQSPTFFPRQRHRQPHWS